MPGRQNALAPYGVAFSKSNARAKGANPVWYFEIGSAIDTALQNLFNLGLGSASGQPLLTLSPYLEGVGHLPNGRMKEFAWEREWRHVGDFRFVPSEVALIIAPEAAHRRLEARFGRPCVDADWGLDRMVTSLLTTNSQS